MKCLVFLCGILLLGITTGPVSAQTRKQAIDGNAGHSATQRLRSFFSDDWKYWMTEYPAFATSVGYPGQNDRWTDYWPEAIVKRNHHLEESLKTLHRISRSLLPPSEQLNYDLYESLLKDAVGGLRFHDDALPMASVMPRNLYAPVSQMMGGITQEVPDIISLMPAARAKDYEDIVARLNGLPVLVDQIIALMRDGLAHGWTPPKITMRDVPKQIESQIVSDAFKSPLLDAFKKFPATIPLGEQKELSHKAEAAYLNSVVPALRKLHDFLTETYIPGCRETIAVSGLPGGADFYKFMVRWQTTTDMTPEQIHEIGLDQVKKIHSEMDQVIARSGFKGNFQEFVKFLKTDPQFYFSNSDDLLLHYRALAKQSDAELAHWIGKLPRLPYGLKPVPDAIAPSQPGGYYEEGSPAAGRPGYFYVNEYQLDSRPIWDMRNLLLHEAVPGHHLQIALAQEMEDVPEFRKELGYTAYVEGWALYSESLGKEIGFYPDPYSEFGYLSAQMWRAVRLVVDTGMHSMGWSRDQAIQYFEDNTGQPEQTAVAEVDRYIVWPGQALGYMIGQLKVLQLREQAEKELGDRFNIRTFHDAILDDGALPLTLLDTKIHTWIAAQKAGSHPK